MIIDLQSGPIPALRSTWTAALADTHEPRVDRRHFQTQARCCLWGDILLPAIRCRAGELVLLSYWFLRSGEPEDDCMIQFATVGRLLSSPTVSMVTRMTGDDMRHVIPVQWSLAFLIPHRHGNPTSLADVCRARLAQVPCQSDGPELDVTVLREAVLPGDIYQRPDSSLCFAIGDEAVRQWLVWQHSSEVYSLLRQYQG